MTKTLWILAAAAALGAAPAAAGEQYDPFAAGAGGLPELKARLGDGLAPAPRPGPEKLPERKRAAGAGMSGFSGFIVRVEGKLHVNSNVYFSSEGKSFLVEDFSGAQKFSLKDRDLHVTLKDEGEFLLGRVNIDPDAVQEMARVPFELEGGVAVTPVYRNWRPPRVSYVFVADITGFGWVRQVTERTQRMLRLDMPGGGRFCYYENIEGRSGRRLHSGDCRK